MKEYKCKNCETIFTGISDSLQCPECEEEFTHTELQVNSEKCNCKEMTCLENCTKKHTCHAYWCEKCEPEKYTSLTTSSSEKKIKCKRCKTVFEYSEMDSDQCPNCFGTMEECTTSPVVTNEGGWEDVVNNFIKKWCGENASHLLDTDDNDGQKLRCFISSTIIEEHRKEQEDILLQIEKEISEKKRDRDYIKIPKELRPRVEDYQNGFDDGLQVALEVIRKYKSE